MPRTPVLPAVVSIVLLCAAGAHAQDAAKPAAPVKPPAPVATPLPSDEPAVQRSVVEDDNARIDELRVRGAVRSITVKPKGPIRAEYEVLPIDASRDPSDGPSTTKGAQGRRVWRVLSF